MNAKAKVKVSESPLAEADQEPTAKAKQDAKHAKRKRQTAARTEDDNVANHEKKIKT